MTEPTPDYHARAAMYRLLSGYAGMVLTNDAKGPAIYRTLLDSTLADERAGDVVTNLMGAALGGYIEKCGGDVQAAVSLIVRELGVAEDLANLGDPAKE